MSLSDRTIKYYKDLIGNNPKRDKNAMLEGINQFHAPGNRTEFLPRADELEDAGRRRMQTISEMDPGNIQGKEASGDFIPGVKRGIQQTQGLLYGGAALAGRAMQGVGMDETGGAVKNWGVEGYKRNMAEAAQYPAKHTFKDVYTGKAGIGGAIDWAQGTLGELVPTMAEAAVGTVLGTIAAPGPGSVAGAFASRTILKKSIDKLTKEAVEAGVKGLTESQIRKQVTRQALKSIGGKFGMGAAVFPLEAGGMYAGLLDEHGVDAPATAMLFGAASTAFEYMGGNSRLIDNLVDAIAKGSTGMIKRTAKEILKGIHEEAMQEGAQELMQVLNTVVNTDEKLLTGKNIEQIVEAAAAGAVGGGAGAVVSGILSKEAPDSSDGKDKKRDVSDAEKILDPDGTGQTPEQMLMDDVLAQDDDVLAASEFTDQELDAAAGEPDAAQQQPNEEAAALNPDQEATKAEEKPGAVANDEVAGKKVSWKNSKGEEITGTITNVTDKIAYVTSDDGKKYRPRLDKLTSLESEPKQSEAPRDTHQLKKESDQFGDFLFNVQADDLENQLTGQTEIEKGMAAAKAGLPQGASGKSAEELKVEYESRAKPADKKLTYEEFKEQYTSLFNEGSKYSPDQVGSQHYSEKMGELSDQYPGWADKVEDEAYQEFVKAKSGLSQDQVETPNDDKMTLTGEHDEKALNEDLNNILEAINNGQKVADSIKDLPDDRRTNVLNAIVSKARERGYIGDDNVLSDKSMRKALKWLNVGRAFKGLKKATGEMKQNLAAMDLSVDADMGDISTETKHPVPSPKGTVSESALSLPNQNMQTHIDERVKNLGSIEAVDKEYSGKDKVDEYARAKAREVYSVKDEKTEISEQAAPKAPPSGDRAPVKSEGVSPGQTVTFPGKGGAELTGTVTKIEGKSAWVTTEDGKKFRPSLKKIRIVADATPTSDGVGDARQPNVKNDDGYIGLNSDGQKVYEDDKGVRSYEASPGLAVGQSVSIIPGRGTSKDSKELLHKKGKHEFLTTDEVAEFEKGKEKNKDGEKTESKVDPSAASTKRPSTAGMSPESAYRTEYRHWVENGKHGDGPKVPQHLADRPDVLRRMQDREETNLQISKVREDLSSKFGEGFTLAVPGDPLMYADGSKSGKKIDSFSVFAPGGFSIGEGATPGEAYTKAELWKNQPEENGEKAETHEQAIPSRTMAKAKNQAASNNATRLVYENPNAKDHWIISSRGPGETYQGKIYSVMPDGSVDIWRGGGEKPGNEQSKPPDRPAGYGKKNKIFTEDAAAKARELLRKKFNTQLNAGLDPEMLQAGITLAGYHVEAGARTFIEYSKAMIADLGEGVKPYLRSFYEGARYFPEMDQKGMTEGKEIDNLNLDKELAATNDKGEQDGESDGQDNERGSGIPEVDPGADPAVPGGRDGNMAGDGVSETDGHDNVLETPLPQSVPESQESEDPETDGLRTPVQDMGANGQGRGSRDEPVGREADGGTGMDADGPGGVGRGGAGRERLGNYHIETPENLIGGTPKVRFKKNQKAIETFNTVLNESRKPTAEERDAIAAYIGWGSFGQDLFKGSWDHPIYKEGWKKENDWLREHLGEKAWKSAQASIINAHYTDPPTVSAIWDIARKLGFKGGRVLEPSMGIGNFFGLMPKDLKSSSDLTGIELDETTAEMARMLYPDANIQQMGYEKSKTADGFYDLVIGNWPFAADGPADRRYNKYRLSLHDYFFVKALDQVREGGLVIGITSSGTMDKKSQLARRQMEKRGTLVAAFRMPMGAFKEYAGTSVVADILVFQKHNGKVIGEGNPSWMRLTPLKDVNGEPVTIEGRDIMVNEYWEKNPDNVLGNMTVGHGTTQGRPGMIVERKDGYGNILKALAERFPSGIMTKRNHVDNIQYISNNTEERQGSITIAKEGKLYIVIGDRLAPLNQVAKYKVKSAKTTAERESEMKALVHLRNKYGELLDAERNGEDGVEKTRKELNRQYNSFVKKYGRINNSFGLKHFTRAGDPMAPALAALENNTGTKEKPVYKPAMVLKESTQRAKRTIENPSISDAFVLVRNDSARTIDIEAVAKLAKTTPEAVKKELFEKDALFETPVGTYEVKDIYLSGNVRQKLRDAEDAQANGIDMERNIKALKEVMPADVPYFSIETNLGATWIPAEIYQQFICEAANLPVELASTIKLTSSINGWIVKYDDAGSLDRRDEARTLWSVPGAPFTRIVRAAFTGQAISIKAKDEDGNEFTDTEASARANEKVDAFREALKDWIWKDVDRRVNLEKHYNEVMNAWATPEYDGSFLSFDGMMLKMGEEEFNLRQHQVNAIWRGIANGRGLYAHEVGTGKTFTMGGIAVESRRYGIAKKPLILAHNANSASVAGDIQEMYPGAKVLYIDNLTPATIDQKLYQIANDDWDAVVLPHSLIDRLTLSRETLDRLAADEILALEEDAIASAEEEGFDIADILDDEEALRKVRGATTAKELVKQRNRIIANIEKQAQAASRENAVLFENLGLDMIIIDEAHEFKKPPMSTRMKVKGLNTASSNRSIALNFLTSYIKENQNGKGVHIFTGTPITNTLNEIYNHMRYVMSDEMERADVLSWDAWFNTFASVESDIERTASGEYEAVSRLAGFHNVSELRRFAGQFMDIVFAEDMPEFVPRAIGNGKTLFSDDLSDADRDELLNGRVDAGEVVGRPYKKLMNEVAEMSPEQRSILKNIIQRANSFKNATGKERREIMLSGDSRNPVIVETDAAKAGFDPRLYDKNLSDHPDNKINRCVAKVLQHYAEHEKASQVIFMEKGYNDTAKRSMGRTDDGDKITRTVETFNAAKDLQAKLVEGGIPAEEIAIVNGKVTKKKRKEIADKVNSGEIRVVIGLTATLGTGVNMQENLRAMHHLDAPWMPGELEQRNGRGHRQGNRWNTVYEYRYITDNIDARRWQVLAKKQKMIVDFLKAKDGVRSIEGDVVDLNTSDLDDINASFSEAAGDARILVREKLKKDIDKLERKKRTHDFGVVEAKSKARDLKNRIIPDYKARLENLKEDMDHFKAIPKDSYSITIEGETFTNRKDAGIRLERAVLALKAETDTRGVTWDEKIIGEFMGFEIVAERGTMRVNYSLDRKGTYPINPSIGSIDATLRNLPKLYENSVPIVQDKEMAMERFEQVAKEPFSQEETLKSKRDLLAQVEADLAQNPDAPPSWLAQGAPIGTNVHYKGKEYEVEGHKNGATGFYVLIKDGEKHDAVSYFDVMDENNLPVYEAREGDGPQFSTTSIKPWAKDFPDIYGHTSTAAIKNHPDYIEAKAGNSESAARLVSDLIKVDRAKALGKQYPNAMLVSAHAEEESGRNKLPEGLARAISSITGLPIDESIVQTNRSQHTKKNAAQRVLSRAVFDGEVISGQEYILIDDVATTGGTLAELRHYIENEGGKVVAISSLSYARGSGKVALQSSTLKTLKERFNQSDLEQLLQDYNVAGKLEALSESEGRYLLKFKSIDSIRDRFFAERQAGSGQVLYSLLQRESADLNHSTTPSVTPDQIKKLFPGQTVGVNLDGSVWVRLQNGAGLIIRNVKQVAEGKYLLSTESGKMDQNGVIAGKYLNSEIELVEGVATGKTLSHEIEHWLEDIGLITAMDKSVLDTAINTMAKKGQFKKLQDQRENRANFLAQYLADRERFRGRPMGRLLQKIADFLDGLLHIGRSSVRKIARGIESGKTFSRPLKKRSPGAGKQYSTGPNKTTINPRFKGKKAGGYNTEAFKGILPDDVAQTMQTGRGIRKETILEKFKKFKTDMVREMDHFPGLSRMTPGKQRSSAREILRRHQEIPGLAQHQVASRMSETLGGLNETEYNMLSMELILGDEVRAIADGLRTNDNLPFNFKSTDEVIESHKKIQANNRKNDKITKALAERRKFQKEMARDLVKYKIMKKEILRDGDYFHHQVLAYWNEKAEDHYKGMGTSSQEVRNKWRPWMAARKGSPLDYNTEYLEAELVTSAQQIAQIETAKNMTQLQKENDILKALKKDAKAKNQRMYNAWAAEMLKEDLGFKDPMVPHSQKIAMGFEGLAKAVANNEITYDSEFQDVVNAIRVAWENKKADKEAWKEAIDDNPVVGLGIEHPRLFPFLSHLLEKNHDGAMYAAMVYKGIKGRNQVLKDVLGDSFSTWKKLVPAGYKEWKPDPNKGAFWVNSITDQVIQDVLTGTKSLDQKDVRRVLAKGHPPVWVIPDGLAETMDNFRSVTNEGRLAQASAWIMSQWKRYILINPLSVLKYNINNTSGDLDVVLAYRPEIAKPATIKKAVTDLVNWAKFRKMDPGLKAELDHAQKLGVIGSGFVVQEVADTMQDVSMEEFARDVIGEQNPRLASRIWKKYWRAAKGGSQIRENILRLAAYRWAKAQMDAGSKVYGASKIEDIDNLVDAGKIDEAAAKLARELLGDYGNISRHGEFIRKHMIPFYSWMEINAPRYVYLMRNLKHEGNPVNRLGLVFAKRSAIFAAKASMLAGAVMLWNMTLFPDELDDLGTEQRRQLHLILGRREDGSIMSIRFQGALSDALSWFGKEDLPHDVSDLVKGKSTIQEQLMAVPKAMLNKTISGIRPDTKALFETLTGESTYPDALSPRPIRDKLENVLKTFKLDIPYRYLAGRPQRGDGFTEHFLSDVLSTITYTTEPGVQAYYDTRKTVFDWKEKHGQERSGGKPTKRGNTLYYYKQALKYGDLEAAWKYKQAYKALGGTDKGMRQSINMAHPLAGIKKTDRYKFKQSLTPGERQRLEKAVEWHRQTYVLKRQEM